MKFITLLTISMTMLFSTSHSFGAEKYKLASKSDVTKLAETVGSQSASNPWHFNNLYDASSDSFSFLTSCGLGQNGMGLNH